MVVCYHDAMRYIRARGPGANRGRLAHDGFNEAVELVEISQQGGGCAIHLGVLTRLRTYSLKADEVEWETSLHVDKLPPATNVLGLRKSALPITHP